jgi:hypothetical protein
MALYIRYLKSFSQISYMIGNKHSGLRGITEMDLAPEDATRFVKRLKIYFHPMIAYYIIIRSGDFATSEGAIPVGEPSVKRLLE